MTTTSVPATASAEKAYAEATEAKPVVLATEAMPVVLATEAKPVAFPSKTKRAAKQAPAAKTPTPATSKKETKMTSKTEAFTAKINEAVAATKAKAQVALAQSNAVFVEAKDFTKGNVEAVVASGKVLAAGVKTISQANLTETRSAYDTLVADAKAFAAVKSPADFFKLQASVLTRNLDSALSLTEKNSKAVLQLANDTFAPLSGRVELAYDKVRKAA